MKHPLGISFYANGEAVLQTNSHRFQEPPPEYDAIAITAHYAVDTTDPDPDDFLASEMFTRLPQLTAITFEGMTFGDSSDSFFGAIAARKLIFKHCRIIGNGAWAGIEKDGREVVFDGTISIWDDHNTT